MNGTGSRQGRLLVAACIAAMAWLALFPITSVDAYYHLATGKRILDERAIPHRGVGSATFGHAPWHDNEWGFQVLAAAVGRTERDADGVTVLTPGGRAALIVLRAAALAGTLALLVGQMAAAGVGAPAAALATLLAAFLTFGNLFWTVRPQILSYLAFAAVAWLLERRRAGRRLALPAAVVVVALWANVHGAFVLGIVLLGCEAAGAWLEALLRRRPAREAWLLTAACAASPIVACANPLGWRQVVHPFLYVLEPGIYAGNNEWTRPDLVHLPLLLATFALLAAAVAAGGRVRAALAIRVAVFTALFLTAIRHLPILALVAVPIVAEAATRAAREGGWRRALGAGGTVAGRPLRRAAAWAGVAFFIVALSGAKFVSPVPRFTERPSRPLPEAEVRFLARTGVPGAVFNAYRFGGFLMLRLYPAERVFMDGRNDLYGTFRTSVYQPILEAAPGWERLWREAVRRYGIDCALLDASDPLAAALRGEPGWHAVPAAAIGGGAGSDGIVLFVRDGAVPAHGGGKGG